MDDRRWDKIFSRVKQHFQNNAGTSPFDFHSDEQIANSMIDAVLQMPSTPQSNFA